jgi:alpha-L-arabinofuranosidase
MAKKIYIIIISIFFVQSCLTYDPIINQETIPVNWGSTTAERIASQVVRIMDQNIRRYDYFIYTYSINENSHQSAWENELKITTYSNGETVSLVFNYFAIHLHYTDNYELRVNGISARIATVRGSVNEFNSTLDRIALLLERKDFSDPIKYNIDFIWLEGFHLSTTSAND